MQTFNPTLMEPVLHHVDDRERAARRALSSDVGRVATRIATARRRRELFKRQQVVAG